MKCLEALHFASVLSRPESSSVRLASTFSPTACLRLEKNVHDCITAFYDFVGD